MELEDKITIPVANEMTKLIEALELEVSEDGIVMNAGLDVTVSDLTLHIPTMTKSDDLIKGVLVNPVRESGIRSESPSLSLLRQRMSDNITRVILPLVLLTIKGNVVDAKLPSILQLKEKPPKRIFNESRKFIKYIMDSTSGGYSINVMYKNKGESGKGFAFISSEFNDLVTASSLKEDTKAVLIEIANKVCPQGMRYASEDVHGTYDAYATIYNRLVKTFNRYAKGSFKDDKIASTLILEAVPTVNDFDSISDYDVMSQFRDSPKVIKAKTSKPVVKKDIKPKDVKMKVELEEEEVVTRKRATGKAKVVRPTTSKTTKPTVGKPKSSSKPEVGKSKSTPTYAKPVEQTLMGAFGFSKPKALVDTKDLPPSE